MTLILVLSVCLWTHADTASPISWASTHNWKIYEVNKLRTAAEIPRDSLSRVHCRALGDDSMHMFLEHATFLDLASSPQWQGCYLATCENKHGQVMKIIISQYGGFFYNFEQGTYYEIGESLRREWLDFMRRAYLRLE